ncbi:sensor histidine kinase [Criibacterium bergeronii]|uniref:histidine kinase n=1 Tax=Criibacterium bergeronii TaxID=1871336 RepID=A0A1C0ADV2_9FIRM|nr:sensor histidine kinase [Criibacterium bergeronii]MBS6062692.1 sensor histidine kinase [Peptostreptococcaceae bacterium]RDY21480.1 sensor histidine kinase [Criibacterium bergeronii]
MISENNSTSINLALQGIIESVQQGKEEIFAISEKIGIDNKKVLVQLEKLKSKVNKQTKDRDELKLLAQESRKKLSDVSSNFNLYSQQDIEQAYIEANKLQLKLTKKENELKLLLNNIESLESRLSENEELHSKSTDILNKIDVISEYLSYDFSKKDNEPQNNTIKWIMLMENEKGRISRDIHDGPAQSVASLVIKTDIIKKLLTKNTSMTNIQNELNDLKYQLRSVINEIRKIIYDLRPSSLNELGIIDSIKGLISKTKENKQINIEFQLIENSQIKSTTSQITCYRVIQECLTNIVKHAKAENVNICLVIEPNYIKIKVNDDGIGFDMTEAKGKDNSFGLSSIKERITLMNGEVDITSTPDGTTINASIPNLGEIYV